MAAGAYSQATIYFASSSPNARCGCLACRPLGMVLTILHLTDLHFHGTPDRHFYRAVLDICCAQPTPDLVVLTGDYVDQPRHSGPIVPLLGRLRWQVAGLAILGNHDYWYDPINIRRRLTRCGYLVLGNGWQQLKVRGEPLIVVGQEGPGIDRFQIVGVPCGAISLVSESYAGLFSVETTARNGLNDRGPRPRGLRFACQFSGSLFVPSRYSRHYDAGTFKAGNSVMYVSRGLAGREPLRWNCLPEVSVPHTREKSRQG